MMGSRVGWMETGAGFEPAMAPQAHGFAKTRAFDLTLLPRQSSPGQSQV